MGGYETVRGWGIKNLDNNHTVEMGRKEFMWKILWRKNQQVLQDCKMTLNSPAGKSKMDSPDSDKKKTTNGKQLDLYNMLF